MKLFFDFLRILFICMLMFGCTSCNSSSDYEKIADKITEKTAKKLKEQKNLCLVGTGGQMMHDIQMMAMSFNYYQEVDLQAARKLIVSALEEYLAAINNSQEIKPYLHQSPFTAKNIEIRIWIYNPDRSELPLEKIYCITSINGVLKYYIRTNPYQAIHEESYEEALKAVAANQNVARQIALIIGENSPSPTAKSLKTKCCPSSPIWKKPSETSLLSRDNCKNQR